jgi:hypothetical protein
VVYVDEDRVQQVYEIPVGMGKRTDALCSQHGGKGEPLRLTGAEWDEWWAGVSAFRLYQADDYWHSRNPKVRRQAREIYRNLLKDFASEPIVEKNRDRIKARSEAAIED